MGEMRSWIECDCVGSHPANLYKPLKGTFSSFWPLFQKLIVSSGFPSGGPQNSAWCALGHADSPVQHDWYELKNDNQVQIFQFFLVNISFGRSADGNFGQGPRTPWWAEICLIQSCCKGSRGAQAIRQGRGTPLMSEHARRNELPVVHSF